ncbi:MAG TPA: hypothetical protein VFZ37_21930 [Jiangellaceae bacterium]
MPVDLDQVAVRAALLTADLGASILRFGQVRSRSTRGGRSVRRQILVGQLRETNSQMAQVLLQGGSDGMVVISVKAVSRAGDVDSGQISMCSHGLVRDDIGDCHIRIDRGVGCDQQDRRVDFREPFSPGVDLSMAFHPRSHIRVDLLLGLCPRTQINIVPSGMSRSACFDEGCQ